MGKTLELTYGHYVAGTFLAEDKSGCRNPKSVQFSEKEIQDYIACVNRQLTERGYDVKIIPSAPYAAFADSVFGELTERYNTVYHKYFAFENVEDTQVVALVKDAEKLHFWREILTTDFFSQYPVEVFQIMTNDESVDALYYGREHTTVYFCDPSYSPECTFRAVQYNCSDSECDFINKVHFLNDRVDAMPAYRPGDHIVIKHESEVPYKGWFVAIEIFGHRFYFTLPERSFHHFFKRAGVDEETEKAVREYSQ